MYILLNPIYLNNNNALSVFSYKLYPADAALDIANKLYYASRLENYYMTFYNTLDNTYYTYNMYINVLGANRFVLKPLMIMDYDLAWYNSLRIKFLHYTSYTGTNIFRYHKQELERFISSAKNSAPLTDNIINALKKLKPYSSKLPISMVIVNHKTDNDTKITISSKNNVDSISFINL